MVILLGTGLISDGSFGCMEQETISEEEYEEIRAERSHKDLLKRLKEEADNNEYLLK